MTRIETNHQNSNSSPSQLFNFLADLNNFEQLMPEGKIEKWQSDPNQCEFTIKGMARIGLKKVSESSPDKISIESFGKVPFNFTLDIHLAELGDGKTEAYMLFEGDINPFMKMMVEKPLTNFFNMLVEKAVSLSL